MHSAQGLHADRAVFSTFRCTLQSLKKVEHQEGRPARAYLGMCDSCECTPVQGKGHARAAEAKHIGSHVPLHARRCTQDVQQRGNWTQVIIQMA